MTTGQRIAAKRKEQKLSQEGLGEALGVSRQSIYKWESDASLPEIDKLVALSRLFGVSVGWLLGVEADEAQTEGGPQSDTLTEGQQKMVEEILNRYQQAQPALPKKHRGKGLVWVLAAVCAVMLYNISVLSDKLERMDNRYQNLQSSINSVTNSVNSQISSITGRVEEALKAQSDLTADYGVEIFSADLKENTVTFSAHVVPRTHTPGMEVRFLADHGEGPAVEVTAAEGADHKFTAQITCPLTDEIDISVALVTPEARQTQALEGFYHLYSGSLPVAELDSFDSLSFCERGEDGLFHLRESWMADVTNANVYTPAEDSPVGRAELVSLKVGLFRDRKLIQWLETGEKPEDYYRGYGPDKVTFYRQPELTLDLKDGERLCFAALLTDEYGRSRVITCIPSYRVTGDLIEYDSDPDMKFAETDPSFWDFDP